MGTKEIRVWRACAAVNSSSYHRGGGAGDVAQSVCEDAQGTILVVGTANGGLARKECNQFVSRVAPTARLLQLDPLIESVTVCPDATTASGLNAARERLSFFAGEVHRVNHEAALSYFPLETSAGPRGQRHDAGQPGRVWLLQRSGAYYFHHGR